MTHEELHRKLNLALTKLKKSRESTNNDISIDNIRIAIEHLVGVVECLVGKDKR